MGSPPIVTACAYATGSVITYPAPTNTEASRWLMPVLRVPEDERLEERLGVVIWTFFLDVSMATSGLPESLVA